MSNWTGFDAILNAMQAQSDLYIKAVDGIIQDEAQSIYDDSQIDVPVDTGDLKGSGHVVTGHLEATVTYGDGDATATKYDYGALIEEGEADGYAWFVELSTVNMPAQPYLEPNFVAHAKSTLDRIHDL